MFGDENKLQFRKGFWLGVAVVCAVEAVIILVGAILLF